jgi:hypothetical protein
LACIKFGAIESNLYGDDHGTTCGTVRRTTYIYQLNVEGGRQRKREIIAFKVNIKEAHGVMQSELGARPDEVMRLRHA